MSPTRARPGRALCIASNAFCAAWAASAGAAGGQEAEPLQTGPVEEIVVVADRPARAPAAPTTIIQTARFAGEARSVAELLTAAPGVTIHSLGGPGQLSTLSLRGASADQSLVLLDGIPLKGPGGGAIDLSTLPASLLDTLVVSRGVLGAQLGAGALGGALELLPRSAGRERSEGGAQVEVGSFGTARLSADLSTRLAAGGLTSAVQLDTTRGDYVYSRQYTPELPDAPYYDETRINADSKRAGALLRWAQGISDSTELDVLLQGTIGERGLPGPIGNLTPQARVSDAGGVAGVRLRGVGVDWVWAVRAWARHDRIALRALSATADCSDGQPGCETNRQRSSAAAGEVQLGRAIGSAQWLRAIVGLGSEFASGDGLGRRQRSLVTLALTDDVRVATGLSLHPAVRVEKVGANWGASPGVGALYRFAALDRCSARPEWYCPLELRLGIGRSFRSPSFAELYLDQGGVAPNPDLVPERALSLDAGVAWRGQSVTLSFSSFVSFYRDLIIYELFPPFRAKPFNFGAARIAGFEAQALAPLPGGFYAEAAYSFLRARNDTESLTQRGQPLPYRPSHRVFLRLARRGDRVEGYAEMSATSSMPRNSFGTSFMPAQFVANIGVGARIAGPVWLDVEVKNVLDDRKQQDLFLYPLPGLSITTIARGRL